MSSVRIQTGDTERIEALILDDSADPLTGKTDILISIRRVSDGFYYDFDDDTFKSSGWTDRQVAMTEVSATNSAGEYYYDFDTSNIISPATDDTYEIRVDQSPGTDAANVPLTGEVKVGHFVDDIDAAITSRAVAGDEMTLEDDAITLAKFDETTAWPLEATDNGATEVARTGADGDTLETLSDQIDGVAVPGDDMNLADDAITASKFDETTAYPLVSADSGATEVARTGADADTLETLSDQIDGVQSDTDDIQTRLPAALVGGRMDSDVGNMQTDTVDANALAADAVAEIQSGLATPGDEMNLADDAITSAKYDEATAYPLGQADTGASEVARTGADGDTLETLSDQIDGNEDILNDIMFSGGTVYVDEANGSSGTAWPKGTWKDPVDNMADALTIAVARNSHRLDIRTSTGFTLAAALSNYTVVGHGPGLTKINTGSQDVGGCSFSNLEITGIVGGLLNKYIHCENCYCNDLSGFTGDFYNCVLGGDISPSLALTLQHCSTLTPGSPVPVDDVVITMQAGYDISIQGMNGNIILKGVDLSFGDSFINFDSGTLEIDSTCVDGTITVGGDCVLTDNHGGTCTVVDNTIVNQLSTVHGSGSWESDSESDWSTAEREQIRDSLGVDGDKTAATGGQMQDKAEPGDEMNLVDDAITSDKYDEATAYPIKSDDSGATKIARTGADGDTLETISDQIDAVQTDLDDPNQYKADVSGVPAAVDSVLTAAHGTGSWQQSASSGDWTMGEREQIRDALGIDGTKTTATGGQLQALAVQVAAVLTAIGLLHTDVEIKDAVWQEAFAGYTTDTQMGYLMNKFLRALVQGDAKQEGNQWIVYDPDAPATPLVTFNTYAQDTSPADVAVYHREKA